jgi:DNA-binding PadR family transcriptional regulator
MTNAELAILGLVAEKPRHGYEIEQVIEHRGMRNWTEIGFSSIYYLLKKLEGEGLVEGHLEEAERGPARKVYQATAAGRRALEAGSLEALVVPRPWSFPVMLGLAHLPTLPPDRARASLLRYRDSITDRLTHLAESRDKQQPLPYFVDAMFEYSQCLLEAELGWLDRFLRRMEEEHDQS